MAFSKSCWKVSHVQDNQGFIKSTYLKGVSQGWSKKRRSLKITTYVYKQVTLYEAKAKIPTWNSTSQVDGKKTSYQNQLTKIEWERGGLYRRHKYKGGGGWQATHNP